MIAHNYKPDALAIVGFHQNYYYIYICQFWRELFRQNFLPPKVASYITFYSISVVMTGVIIHMYSLSTK